MNKKMLEIIFDVDLKSFLKILFYSFYTIIAHLYDTLNSQTPLVNTFKMVGSDGVEVEFGLIPNLDKMSYGEWEDLENYIWDNKSLHRAMAVLYRPLIWQIGGKYRIHEYQGTDFYADLMKEMPIDVATGDRSLFKRNLQKIGKDHRKSIQSTYKANKKKRQQVG